MITPILLALSLQAGSAGGTVFSDANGNGVRDANEQGVRGVAVSNQDTVVVTDASGAYRLPRGKSGIVFVSVPDGYQATRSFWRAASDAAGSGDFALRPAQRVTQFTFIHASDTHIAAASLARTQRLRALADSIAPAFTLITGDLVRDALRVGEAEATGYYDLFAGEISKFRNPVYTVPGNHENFGIERSLSKVDASHPLYGRAMYHHYRGPDYYSFTYGGVHFVGLNTVDIDDQWYYGHIDDAQLAWLKLDLAAIPAAMPVVTFNHIPFLTAVDVMNGYTDAPPAPTLITVKGKTAYRHVVSNTKEVLAAIGTARLPVALGGHMHTRESLRYEGVPTRFEQTAAIVGPAGSGPMRFPSGFMIYRVLDGKIDAGTFVAVP